MLSVVDGSLALVPWEHLHPAMVQEIQRESSSTKRKRYKNVGSTPL